VCQYWVVWLWSGGTRGFGNTFESLEDDARSGRLSNKDKPYAIAVFCQNASALSSDVQLNTGVASERGLLDFVYQCQILTCTSIFIVRANFVSSNVQRGVAVQEGCSPVLEGPVVKVVKLTVVLVADRRADKEK